MRGRELHGQGHLPGDMDMLLEQYRLLLYQ
jgi:hypothetical protein